MEWNLFPVLDSASQEEGRFLHNIIPGHWFVIHLSLSPSSSFSPNRFSFPACTYLRSFIVGMCSVWHSRFDMIMISCSSFWDSPWLTWKDSEQTYLGKSPKKPPVQINGGQHLLDYIGFCGTLYHVVMGPGFPHLY